jgi:hypothetical protein
MRSIVQRVTTITSILVVIIVCKMTIHPVVQLPSSFNAVSSSGLTMALASCLGWNVHMVCVHGTFLGSRTICILLGLFMMCTSISTWLWVWKSTSMCLWSWALCVLPMFIIIARFVLIYFSSLQCDFFWVFFVLFSRLPIRLTSVNLLLVPVLHHTSKLKLYWNKLQN